MNAAFFEVLFQNPTVGFALFDEQLRYLRVNERLADINGLPSAAHAGKHLCEVVPDLAADILETIDRIRQTGKPVVNHELCGQTPATPGRARYWNESWYPVTGAQGELVGYCAMVEETTTEKAAQEGERLARDRELAAIEKADANHRLYSAVFQHMPIAVGVMDRDGRYLIKNEKMDRFCLAADPSRPSPADRWYAYDDDNRRIAPADYPAQRALRGETAEPGTQFLYVGEDGIETWTRVSAAPLRDVGGRVIGAITLVRDIGEFKRADDCLRASEQRLRLAIEAARMATWDMDLTTGRSVWNARRFELFGYPVNPAGEGSYDMWISRLHPDDRERVLQINAEARRGAQPYWNEYRIVRADNGETRWLSVASRVLQNDRGDASRWIGVALDVTDRKRLEDELRSTAERLAAADRRKDEFLAMLAHELRNPLAPIKNAVSVLKAIAPRDNTTMRMHDIIDRQVHHLARLVDDLLDVARVTKGNISLSRETLQLSDVLHEGMEIVQRLVQHRKQTIRLRVQRDLPAVQGDRTRLVQVMGNLLTNASKFTDDGGTITVGAEAAGGQVVIEVADNGIGMEAAFLPHVFELFSQAHRTLDRAQGGLGIGLSLVKSILEMHGGSIAASSEGLGRGSKFTIRLPATAQAASGRVSADPPARSKRARRVLVVDDNLDQASTLSELLCLAGHRVRQAHDGPSALELADEFHPEIVLLDLGLPGMNGFEVARRLRAGHGCSNVRLIALTGYGQAEDMQATSAAGFDDHLVKPVDADMLMPLLDR